MQPDNSKSGIESLKMSFLLYMGAGILGWLPVVSTLGILFDLLALILLIVGWRTLGRSTLPQAPNYKSTGSWMVRAIIIAVVVSVVGGITVTVWLVGSVISGVPQALQNGAAPNASTVLQQFPALTTFIEYFVVLGGVVAAIWLGAWVKMCLSMKRLAIDIRKPRVNTAGNLFILQIFLGFGNVGFSFFLFQRTMSFATNPRSGNPLTGLYSSQISYLFQGGYLSLFALVALSATTVLVIASYLGYSGLKAFQAENIRPSPPPTITSTPPASPWIPSQTRPAAMNFCPMCGHKLDSPLAANCKFCGVRLVSV